MSFCGNLQIADSRKSVWPNAVVSYGFAGLPLEIDRFLVSGTFWGSAIHPFWVFLVISHMGFICAGITPKQDKPQGLGSGGQAWCWLRVGGTRPQETEREEEVVLRSC